MMVDTSRCSFNFSTCTLSDGLICMWVIKLPSSVEVLYALVEVSIEFISHIYGSCNAYFYNIGFSA